MRKEFKVFIAATAFALPAAFLGAQDAAAVVISWDYKVSAGFKDFAPATVTASLPGTKGGEPTRLSWGVSTGLGQSALVIKEPVATPFYAGTGPLLVTSTCCTPGISLTHENRPITGFDPGALTDATLDVRVTLTPNTPPGPPIPGLLPDINFGIKFKETLNVAPCAVPTSPTPCNDIFVLTNPANLTVTVPGPDGLYNVSLHVVGLATLPDAACAAVGVAAGCVGVTTPEGADTTITTNFEIHAAAVPEPATVLLLGSGLAGLGLYRWKKVNGKV